MAKTKFTPGPWTYDDTYGLIVANGGRVEVAACHAGRGGDAKANADLMAAAPEMLDALDELNRFLVANVDPEKIRVSPDAHLRALRLIGRFKRD